MADRDGFRFPHDLVEKVEAGDTGPPFLEELQKLTTEQRGQLAEILIERKAQRGLVN